MEMLPPPEPAEPSVHSMAIAEPPADATTVHVSRQGQVMQSTLTKSYKQSHEQETQFVTTTKNVDRDSMDSDTINAILEDSLHQPGNRDSNTMELLAAVASDEEVPNDEEVPSDEEISNDEEVLNDKDNTALL